MNITATPIATHLRTWPLIAALTGAPSVACAV
jgi:hypothetical protein